MQCFERAFRGQTLAKKRERAGLLDDNPDRQALRGLEAPN